jgi:methyl-accepting chemotaxis protein
VEIRRLADNVVASTAEIEGRITEILDSVNRLVMSSEKTSGMMQEGHRASVETVGMLMEVVNGVEECADSARQISLSTQQQQIASSQILIAIKDINQGARDATASAQESSRVAEELTTMAEKLKGLLGRFRLGEAASEARGSGSSR